MKVLLYLLVCTIGQFAAKENKVHIVKIEGMRFVPSSIQIKAGETVQWINDGRSLHNVEAVDGSFSSGMLGEDQKTFSFTFNNAGTFKYFCRPHKMMGMKGTVTVRPE